MPRDPDRRRVSDPREVCGVAERAETRRTAAPRLGERDEPIRLRPGSGRTSTPTSMLKSMAGCADAQRHDERDECCVPRLSAQHPRRRDVVQDALKNGLPVGWRGGRGVGGLMPPERLRTAATRGAGCRHDGARPRPTPRPRAPARKATRREVRALDHVLVRCVGTGEAVRTYDFQSMASTSLSLPPRCRGESPSRVAETGHAISAAKKFSQIVRWFASRFRPAGVSLCTCACAGPRARPSGPAAPPPPPAGSVGYSDAA